MPISSIRIQLDMLLISARVQFHLSLQESDLILTCYMNHFENHAIPSLNLPNFVKVCENQIDPHI